MTNPTPHGQVPEALNQLFERLEDCIYEWSNYVRADDAPTTLPKYTAGAINDLRVAVTGLYLRTQQPAPATQQAGEPAFWMNEKGHTWSHSDWKQFPKHRAKYPIPLYPHFPAPQPSTTAQAADSVLEDAARYRWLRNKSTVLHNTAWLGGATAVQRDVDFLRRDDALAALDAAIDAARKRGANHD